jgi:hypothetical protein
MTVSLGIKNEIKGLVGDNDLGLDVGWELSLCEGGNREDCEREMTNGVLHERSFPVTV